MKKILLSALMLIMLFVPISAIADDDMGKVVNTVSVIEKSNNHLTISWDKVSGCDGYIVERYYLSEDVFKVKEIIKGESNTVYTEIPNAGHTYKYRICAYTGDVKGEYSDLITVKTFLMKPYTPKNVKVKGKDWNKIKVTWDMVDTASGYQVYKYSSSQGKYVIVKTIKGKSKTSYTESGLYPDSKYSYKVRSFKSKDGDTVYSKKSDGKSGRTLTSVGGLQLVRPLKNMHAGSGYGPRGGGFHIGGDYMKPKGTPVYAAADGYVERSKSNFGGLGNGIRIRHKNGVVTWYGHMNSRCVSQGSYVKAGQKIGTVGATGNANGCVHLHYEVWVNGQHYNPECFY